MEGLNGVNYVGRATGRMRIFGHTPDKASKRKANRNAVAASRANETPEQSLERKSKKRRMWLL